MDSTSRQTCANKKSDVAKRG